MAGAQLFEGYGAVIEVTDDGIIIRRRGLVAFSLHGLKGEKRIPFSSISAVQFKPASMLTSGYIQFSIIGGNESRGGLVAATKDENSVIFKGKHQTAQFAKLREIVEEAARKARTPSVTQSNSSIADQLSKLADLLDRGLLTQEEFAKQKSALIG
ncbi:DUF4429 domain-containing protein [Novosphingobium sp. EMRT-2]|uniref:DUF4429 domain-containing protein n=1 Tax=Novosphingobium sp. EMRT-2 TaxID=2571749 RepID=UPI0010BD847A|nr:DUF4429 domain-containing protein [Novosphingobium sp. EMRT-2]QCI92906.1 DUF4429 domain-containing protein [Novosphingobium sp. EMRT-2]